MLGSADSRVPAWRSAPCGLRFASITSHKIGRGRAHQAPAERARSYSRAVNGTKGPSPDLRCPMWLASPDRREGCCKDACHIDAEIATGEVHLSVRDGFRVHV